MKNRIALLVLFVIAFSCSEDDELKFESANSILFGAIYGECAGDCRNLYLLTEQALYIDSNTDTIFGNWEHTSFKNVALPTAKFELAKTVLDIPEGLLKSTATIEENLIADFDYFVRIELNGKSKTWTFDEISETTDSVIKDYFKNLILIYRQLQE